MRRRMILAFLTAVTAVCLALLTTACEGYDPTSATNSFNAPLFNQKQSYSGITFGTDVNWDCREIPGNCYMAESNTGDVIKVSTLDSEATKSLENYAAAKSIDADKVKDLKAVAFTSLSDDCKATLYLDDHNPADKGSRGSGVILVSRENKPNGYVFELTRGESLSKKACEDFLCTIQFSS